ncbi:MAG TPA: DUF4344 domain-containing metallopeptidase, partial [Longimicrobium sp.]
MAVPSTAASQAGFHVVVRAPVQNVRRHAVHQEWISQSRMLQLLAKSVNENFAIPEQAWITAEECGQVNAFWRPAERTITLCYELIDAIFNEFRYDGLSQEAFGTAVASATMFIAMHEVGHALVDILNLPVTGREEDVVDQFAAIALGHDDPAPALWAAEFWRTKDDLLDTGLKVGRMPYEDEHSFDMQRFYNVLCWTYGKDPQNRASVLRSLPQGRAARCPGEYQRMASSWERILAPHQRAAVSRLPPPPPPARVANMGGTWDIREQIGTLTSDFYCESQIQMTIQQSAQVFTAPYRQTGRCTISGQQLDNPGQGAMQSGRIDGTQIFFQMETCNYAGVLQAG